MALFTYDDFLKEATKAGLYDTFSAADIKIAQADADAGMALLGYKQQYNKAATDEERQTAHNAAETIRGSYGYTGGGDGSGYNPAPSGTTAGRSTDEMVTELENQLYNNKFSYDPASDTGYQAKKAELEAQRKLGVEDTLGAYATNTGGRASTAAVSAAQQTSEQYSKLVADALAEAEQKKYEQYSAEQNNASSLLSNLYAKQNAKIEAEQAAAAAQKKDAEDEKSQAYALAKELADAGFPSALVYYMQHGSLEGYALSDTEQAMVDETEAGTGIQAAINSLSTEEMTRYKAIGAKLEAAGGTYYVTDINDWNLLLRIFGNVGTLAEYGLYFKEADNTLTGDWRTDRMKDDGGTRNRRETQ